MCHDFDFSPEGAPNSQDEGTSNNDDFVVGSSAAVA